MNPETFLQNKKNFKKYSNSKNFVSLGTLTVKFQQIALKFVTLYLFYPFLVSLYKILLKTLLSVLSFQIHIWTRMLWNLPFNIAH